MKTHAPPPGTEVLRVDLGVRAYDIVVGIGLMDIAGLLVAPLLERPGAVIITDENVAPLYLGALKESLSAAGIGHSQIILPAGEQTKDFAHLEQLTGMLLERGVERGTILIALGGGVIGDIAGFAAAVTLRGMDFIQIPTTLLAQVDSSVGGKTGINTRQGKNLVGAFHQPRLVLADVGVLDSLPGRQLLAGYAEVAKYGLIGEESFFAWLEENAAGLLGGDISARRRAVVASCAAKAGVVAADERETGQRALLNLGHTFGHALEAQTGYSEALLHGESVAIGCAMAFDLSVDLGLCQAAEAERVRRHLQKVGLPTDLSGLETDSWTAERLLDHMRKDKKVRNGQITFILARGIGQAYIEHSVAESAVLFLLQRYLNKR